MEVKKLGDKAITLFKKYKFVALVLLLGIVLMLLPNESDKTSSQPTPAQSQRQFEDPTDQLQNILSQIKGAGKVRLMLTLDGTEQYIYHTDRDESINGESTDIRVETVILTDSNRAQSGLIQQMKAPVYRGAVVVCQGADDPAVKLAIMEAVKNMTGLGFDRISVLKMK